MKVVLFTCYPLHAGQVWRTVHQSLQLAATRLCGFVERKDPVVALWARPVSFETLAESWSYNCVQLGRLHSSAADMVLQTP